MDIPDETLEKLRDAYIAYEIESQNPRYLISKLCLVVEDVLEHAGMMDECRKAFQQDIALRIHEASHPKARV